MSLAWKCDICGALYESDKDGYTNFIRIGLINDSSNANGRTRSFHICSSCDSAVKKVLDDLRKGHNRKKTEEHALYVMTKGGEE